MLGEDHSLMNEFPKYSDRILTLNKQNPLFAKNADRYHLLDTEIRKLELNNAPIDDEALHQLKQERALLKDILYREISSV